MVAVQKATDTPVFSISDGSDHVDLEPLATLLTDAVHVGATEEIKVDGVELQVLGPVPVEIKVDEIADTVNANLANCGTAVMPPLDV